MTGVFLDFFLDTLNPKRHIVHHLYKMVLRLYDYNGYQTMIQIDMFANITMHHQNT
uniref:Uncharacterized protein n=1 Tax=viral metagenome TaxID=1070528 RepID=A0A6C0K093_9ZZZZ